MTDGVYNNKNIADDAIAIALELDDPLLLLLVLLVPAIKHFVDTTVNANIWILKLHNIPNVPQTSNDNHLRASNDVPNRLPHMSFLPPPDIVVCLLVVVVVVGCCF